MTNRYYTYPYQELWQDAPWMDHISEMNALAQWLGAHIPMNEEPFSHRPCSRPKDDPDYRPKTASIDDAETVHYWAKKGIRLTVLAQGGKRWISMAPEKAFVEREFRKLPALVVFHKEHYTDPWWSMRTIAHYAAYNEALAAAQDHVIIYLVSEGPDVDRIYLNIMQEAFVLYPVDLGKIMIDVHQAVETGTSLNSLEGFHYYDAEGRPANPDQHIERFGPLKVPVVNVGGHWGNRDSLTRGLVMNYAMNEGIFDRQAMLHTETAKKMAVALKMEHEFNDVREPGFRTYWEARGLDFAIHETHSERWLTFVPKSALEAPDQKLPLVLIFQEVYPGAEHLAVTSLSYLYEYTGIAAQGECMLLFFVLEDPDSNDLAVQILDEAAAQYPVDRTRVYITGHSHDGHFARIFAYRHPDLLAGLATLGDPDPLYSSEETGNPVGGTEDDMLEALSRIELPVINVGGQFEHKPFATGKDRQNFARGWQRRLAVCRCRMRSVDEILAAQTSANIVERMLRVPVDEGRVLWLDGCEHYIADFADRDGKNWLRLIRIENMPHTVSASMVDLSWSFLRRFAREPETGKIRELY